MAVSVSDLCNEVAPRILSPVLAPHTSHILLFGEGYYNYGTQNIPEDTAASPLEKCSQSLSLPFSSHSLLQGSVTSVELALGSSYNDKVLSHLHVTSLDTVVLFSHRECPVQELVW